MGKNNHKYSVRDEYDKVHVRGSDGNPFGDNKPFISLTVSEISYDATIAVARLSIKEAKKVIELLEIAIEDARADKKKAGKK